MLDEMDVRGPIQMLATGRQLKAAMPGCGMEKLGDDVVYYVRETNSGKRLVRQHLKEGLHG